MFRICEKCLKNEKMKSLLFENEKLHDMKTRKSEKFFVNHANTSRLMNSPIIYMQRLLNEQWKVNEKSLANWRAAVFKKIYQ